MVLDKLFVRIPNLKQEDKYIWMVCMKSWEIYKYILYIK